MCGWGDIRGEGSIDTRTRARAFICTGSCTPAFVRASLITNGVLSAVAGGWKYGEGMVVAARTYDREKLSRFIRALAAAATRYTYRGNRRRRRRRRRLPSLSATCSAPRPRLILLKSVPYTRRNRIQLNGVLPYPSPPHQNYQRSICA